LNKSGFACHPPEDLQSSPIPCSSVAFDPSCVRSRPDGGEHFGPTPSSLPFRARPCSS
jgi:hypothetical protein